VQLLSLLLLCLCAVKLIYSHDAGFLRSLERTDVSYAIALL
jgi:hypothetical protein